MKSLKIEDCNKCFAASEVDCKIGDDTVLRPDVVLICDEPNDAYVTKAPEIIVEIISKSTAKREKVNRKARDTALYER